MSKELFPIWRGPLIVIVTPCRTIGPQGYRVLPAAAT